MYVLDASAFIHEYRPSDDAASVPAVREELEDESAYRYDAMEGAGMHVHVPDDPVLDRVRRAADETGDRAELSETDARLVAAALELDATLVTDDYAMQNVAEHLGVPVEVIAREGIEEKREWLFQCQGCGRTFDEDRDRCPVCGADLARKNPSN
ncbi:DNA-binding protein [Halobacteriales archaeon QS_8_69_26]|nr:MAG: DNA-binding protein [Halobacteriales archaeon QS_8_69_26]